jgi:glycosyl transferase family 25
MNAPLAMADDVSIPAFIINLKESVWRREHMTREMAQAKIPVTFIPAISGNEVTETIGTASINETACALSHLHAIRLIAEGEHEFGAIFEDDLIVSPEAKQFLDINLLSSLPRFDIMQLCDLGTRSALALTIARIAGEHRHIVCIRPRPSMGTQALIYHRTAAQRIVREITEISAPIDVMLFGRADVFGLRIVSVRPAVVVHADFQSTINAQIRPKVRNKIRRELIRGANYIRRTVSFVMALRRLDHQGSH